MPDTRPRRVTNQRPVDTRLGSRCWRPGPASHHRCLSRRTVTGRWFVTRRGLVSGILTAGSATGQLVFLPVVAVISSGGAGGRPRSGVRPPRWPSCHWCSGCCGTGRATSASRRTAAPRPTSRPERASGWRGWHCAPRLGGPGRPVLAAGGRVHDLRRDHHGAAQPHFVPAAHDHGMRPRPRPGCSPWSAVRPGRDGGIGVLTDRFDPGCCSASTTSAGRLADAAAVGVGSTRPPAC